MTIDTHHHMLPDFFWQETENAHAPVGGLAPLRWSTEASISFMDEAGIDVAVVSLSTPGVHTGDSAKAQPLARRCNEFAADLLRERPDLDRAQGQLTFLHAFPFSNNNVFTSIDSKTGRPTVDESKRPGAKQGAEFCPSIGGGKDWPPEAWSPQTQLLYIPANNNICAFLPKGEVPESKSQGLYVGYEVESILGSVRAGAGASDHVGELQAWDLNTGKRVWQHNFKTIFWSPLLVTGGDILFTGGTPDRLFRAFDARTGDQLWSFPLLRSNRRPNVI